MQNYRVSSNKFGKPSQESLGLRVRKTLSRGFSELVRTDAVILHTKLHKQITFQAVRRSHLALVICSWGASADNNGVGKFSRSFYDSSTTITPTQFLPYLVKSHHGDRIWLRHPWNFSSNIAALISGIGYKYKIYKCWVIGMIVDGKFRRGEIWGNFLALYWRKGGRVGLCERLSKNLPWIGEESKHVSLFFFQKHLESVFFAPSTRLSRFFRVRSNRLRNSATKLHLSSRTPLHYCSHFW